MPQPEVEEAILVHMMVHALLVVSYFLVSGGIISDVIVEPLETSGFWGLENKWTIYYGRTHIQFSVSRGVWVS